jgi:hypothetical protein
MGEPFTGGDTDPRSGEPSADQSAAMSGTAASWEICADP